MKDYYKIFRGQVVYGLPCQCECTYTDPFGNTTEMQVEWNGKEFPETRFLDQEGIDHVGYGGYVDSIPHFKCRWQT